MLKADYEKSGLDDFALFWYSELMEDVKKMGLLVV